jgi:competence ComEA-like helix-hairpin-helix protein
MALKRLKRFIKEYLTLNRFERRGFFSLAILILIIGFTPVIYRLVFPPKIPQFNIEFFENKETLDQNPVKFELFDFDPNLVTRDELLSLGMTENSVNNLLKYREAGGKFYQRDDFLKIHGITKEKYLELRKYIKVKRVRQYKDNYQKKFGFNNGQPVIIGINTADSAAFTQLKGIGPVFSARIIKYRKSIRGFDSVQQLLNVYGIDSSLFNAIRPFLILDGKMDYRDSFTNVDSLVKKKEKEFIIVEINAADTSKFKRLKGIGTYYANRIVKYRELLGGFYDVNQIKEVYGIDDELFMKIEDHLVCDAGLITKLNINELNSYELSRHPYISRPLAESIIKLRKRKRKIRDLNELTGIYLMTDALFKQITPYLRID